MSNLSILYISNHENFRFKEKNLIIINYKGQKFIGNKFQILLDQLETNGVKIPYSCRIGVCECCQITLISGKVKMLNKNAIQSDNIILCCSCIPNSNIHLS